MKRSLTGIILAGGMSQRMGTEKGLVIFNGKPLIQYPVELLQRLCDEILISSNNESYLHYGFRVIPDIYPGIGPMGGVLSCLLHSENALNLVIPCDMPFVTGRIYELLLAERGEALVCVPWYEKDRFEPLCGVYHTAVSGEIKKHIINKNYKMSGLFRSASFTPLRIGDIHPPLHDKYFFSMNSPDDLY